jgi:hypothetical protein
VKLQWIACRWVKSTFWMQISPEAELTRCSRKTRTRRPLSSKISPLRVSLEEVVLVKCSWCRKLDTSRCTQWNPSERTPY